MNPLNVSWDWARIGSAFGNHLWQSTVFVGVCWGATLLLKKNSASIRHWVWLVASLKFLLPFSVLVGLGANLASMADVRLAQPEWPALQRIGRPFEALSPTAVDSRSSSEPEPKESPLKPWLLAGGWLFGVSTVVIWRAARWRRLTALIGKATRLNAGRELDTLQRLQARYGLTSRVRLASSNAMLEPGLRGVLRPLLLLPDGITARLDGEQLETIIAHELCHVRRRDNLFAVLHVIVETIFWFHPLVWWIGSRLVDERERACDDEVLRRGSDPAVYAGAILRVCEFYLTIPLTTVSRVTGSNLKKRIEDIMTQRNVVVLSGAKKFLLAGVASVSIGVPVVFGMVAMPAVPAQPIAPTASEVASPVPAVTPVQPQRTQTPASASVQTVQNARPPIPVTRAPQPELQATRGQYIIGPEDELEISVWRDPELTRRVVVRPDGKIGFPLLGDVTAAGLTPMTLKSDIATSLSQYLTDPVVTVIVAQPRKREVSIQGAIASPGVYPLTARMTLVQLLAQAGGLTAFAKRDQIAVFRDVGGAVDKLNFNYTAYQAGSVDQNVILQDGDIIIVP